MNNNQSQYLLASIVESSQDSIVTIDLNNTITSWNKGAEYLYGYPYAEVIGKSLEMVLLPFDMDQLIDKVSDIIHEINVPIYETVRVHKNGRHIDLEILLSPVRNPAGKVIGVSTVARDITRRKMQENQKDEFIAVASHELKTPVTSIKAYSEILLEQLEHVGEKSHVEMLKKLNNQVARLVGLIDTLLDTTNLAAGEILLNVEQFSLTSLIREQIDAVKHLSDRHHVIFESGEIRHVRADRRLIGQAISNILSNAYKYSPQGGKIIITLSESAEGAKVSIQDFGVGIPGDVKQKIFERYFRVKTPHTSTTSGIGLELYITAGIIRQHGGALSVESGEGVGSTFHFTLPFSSDFNPVENG
jgi:two-component system sensor histidine kinase VicK